MPKDPTVNMAEPPVLRCGGMRKVVERAFKYVIPMIPLESAVRERRERGIRTIEAQRRPDWMRHGCDSIGGPTEKTCGWKMHARVHDSNRQLELHKHIIEGKGKQLRAHPRQHAYAHTLSTAKGLHMRSCNALEDTDARWRSRRGHSGRQGWSRCQEWRGLAGSWRSSVSAG